MLSSLSHFHHARHPSPQNGVTHIQGGSPFLVKSFWKSLHRHMWNWVLAGLDPVELKIDISHHALALCQCPAASSTELAAAWDDRSDPHPPSG